MRVSLFCPAVNKGVLSNVHVLCSALPYLPWGLLSGLLLIGGG